jgi:hypothetical protein
MSRRINKDQKVSHRPYDDNIKRNSLRLVYVRSSTQRYWARFSKIAVTNLDLEKEKKRGRGSVLSLLKASLSLQMVIQRGKNE